MPGSERRTTGWWLMGDHAPTPGPAHGGSVAARILDDELREVARIVVQWPPPPILRGCYEVLGPGEFDPRHHVITYYLREFYNVGEGPVFVYRTTPIRTAAVGSGPPATRGI